MFYPIGVGDEEALVQLCSSLPRSIEETEILEIGSGRSTSVLNRFGSVDVVEIDVDRANAVKARKRYITDSISFKPEQKYDLIFIDGCHLYTHIKNDIDVLWPAVKDGGILCGHDYEGIPWDERFIEQDYVNEKHHGVAKAVYEAFKGQLRLFLNSSVWSVRRGGW
jgi:hypothetical protein